MASMRSKGLFRRRGDKLPVGQAQPGLPVVNYRLPLVTSLATTALLFLVLAFLTLVSVANVLRAFSPADDTGSATLGGFFCGVTSLLGVGLCLYTLWAILKGVRDLMTPIHYTRGSIADKRSIAGRIAGEWIGVSPSYVGADIAVASHVTDEQAAASADHSRIVQTRSAPLPRLQPKGRGGYLAPGRISMQASPLVTDADLSDDKPKNRAVFRVDAGAYSLLKADEEVLVAHSRFLEHIFYVAHLRDGEWESFKNNALI
ncbi:MAG: hypothetical protein ABJA50_05230 [Chloroflexota bacterium]